MTQERDPGRLEFDVLLTRRGTGVGFLVPFAVAEVFGTRGQVKVLGTLDAVPYRSSIAPMGGGTHSMVVRQELCEALGKTEGAPIHVVMERDREERVVPVPDDFRAALAAHPAAATTFDRFAYTHRKEYVDWITSAKQAETRRTRIAKAVERIAAGVKFS